MKYIVGIIQEDGKTQIALSTWNPESFESATVKKVDELPVRDGVLRVGEAGHLVLDMEPLADDAPEAAPPVE